MAPEPPDYPSCHVAGEKPGFCCRECDQWIGDVLYQADITNATAWDDWCLDCYLIHQHGGGRLNPKTHNAQILLGLSQGRTQQEVGDSLGISQKSVSDAINKIIPYSLLNSAS